MSEYYEANQQAFQRYEELLLTWNQKINLTAITEPEKVRELHFLDSLAVADYLVERQIVPRGTISENFRVLDLGAGAGFPGLPLKIALPSVQLTLADSVKKKCDFMKEVARQLQLKDVKVLHETLRVDLELGQFDLIVSRAVGRVKDLLPILIPHLGPEGRLIFMKGPDGKGELEEVRLLLREFSLGFVEAWNYSLPSGRIHQLLVFQKN